MGNVLGSAFLIFFCLFWSAITLGFDVYMGSNALRQWRAGSYPTVLGRVLESRIESSSDSDGTTYRPHIEYEYEVGGQRHVSEQVRYGMSGTSDRSYARDIVSDHEVEKFITVHYNPDDPGDAVLLTGLDALDYFMALFLIPFNAVMLTMWYGAAFFVVGKLRSSAGAGKAERESERIGGARVQRQGWETRLAVNRFPAFFMFLIGAGGSAFLLIFVVALIFGFNSRLAAQAALVLALGAGIWLAVRQVLANRSPRNDLVIDRAGTQIILPPGEWRKEPQAVELTSISSIDTETITRTDSDGDKTHHYATRVHYLHGGSTRAERVMKWSDQAEARRLTRWLCRELGLPEPSDESATR